MSKAGRKWTNQDEIQKKKIIKVLKESKVPLTLTKIADKSGLYRQTVAKYLPKMKKQIETIDAGRWELYKIKRK